MIDYISEFMKQKSDIRILKHKDECFLDFSSNDYLNLSQNIDSFQAGYDAVKKYGTGSTGSRLLSGNIPIFEKFENEIAKTKNYESSLIFNSGFIANYSVISAFCIPKATVIFDKLNHASMYTAVANNNINLVRYRHLDYNHLEEILKHHSDTKKIISSETVFGMDGDIADISALSYLAQKYDAILYLDEAHATGLYGNNGYGLSTTVNLDPNLSIVMGTFSKALASNGAYVAMSNLIKQYLIQISKGFVYSTALSPFNIGVAQHNWNMIPSMSSERSQIMSLAELLRNNLSKLGYTVKGDKTNIVPILFNSEKDMFHIHDMLMKSKILTSAIRKPTSPTPRIRIAINASHTAKDLNNIIEVLSNV